MIGFCIGLMVGAAFGLASMYLVVVRDVIRQRNQAWDDATRYLDAALAHRCSPNAASPGDADE